MATYIGTILPPNGNAQHRTRYQPNSVRLTHILQPGSPLTFSIGIPDLCQWRQGDWFRLVPPGGFASSGMTLTLGGDFGPVFTCLETLGPGTTVTCTARVSHPCPWDFWDENLPESLSTSQVSLPRAWVPNSIPTLTLTIGGPSVSFPPDNGVYYINYLYNTHGLDATTFGSYRILLQQNPVASEAHLPQALCPTLVNPDSNSATMQGPDNTWGYIATSAIAPGNHNWLAKKNVAGVDLVPGLDIQRSFLFQPFVGCYDPIGVLRNDIKSTLFWRYNPFVGTSHPTFNVMKNDIAQSAMVGVNSYTLTSFPVASANLGKWLTTTNDQPSLTDSSTVWQSFIPTTPSVSDLDLSAAIGFNLQFDQPVNCPTHTNTTRMTSCLAQLAPLPYQDHFPYRSGYFEDPTETIDITLVRASMTVTGDPMGNRFRWVPNTDLGNYFQIGFYRYLDRITFDFGHAPGLIHSHYIQHRNYVYVVVKGKDIDLEPISSGHQLPNTRPQTQIFDATSAESIGTAENMQCIWEFGYVYGSNQSNGGHFQVQEQVAAMSPESFYPSFYVSGGASESTYDYNTSGHDHLGIYNLPTFTQTLNTKIRTESFDNQEQITTTSLRLTCFIIPTTPINLSSTSTQRFTIGMEGPQSFGSQFTQPFAVAPVGGFTGAEASVMTTMVHVGTPLRAALDVVPTMTISSNSGYNPSNIVIDTVVKFTDGQSNIGMGDSLTVNILNMPFSYVAGSVTPVRCVLLNNDVEVSTPSYPDLAETAQSTSNTFSLVWTPTPNILNNPQQLPTITGIACTITLVRNDPWVPTPDTTLPPDEPKVVLDFEPLSTQLSDVLVQHTRTQTLSSITFPPPGVDPTLPPVTPTPPPSTTNPCDQCSTVGTKQCNPTSQQLPPDQQEQQPLCECNDGYQGPTCLLSTTSPCLNKIDDVCNSPLHGFVNVLPDGMTCDNHCTCYNQFLGSDCGLCGLECQYGGRPYKDCFRCGCPAGIIGDHCQCRKVTGTITLAAVNDIIMESGGSLSSTPSTPFEINHSNTQLDRLVNSPFPSTLTTPLQSDLDLYLILEQMYNAFVQPLTTKTTQDNAKLIFTVTPTPTSPTTSTTFTFDIIFGCGDYNPHWTNQDTVMSQWQTFGNQFSTLPIIQSLFQNPSPATTSPLSPTPSTLPPIEDDPDDASINGVYHNQSTLLSLIVIIMIFTITTNLSAFY